MSLLSFFRYGIAPCIIVFLIGCSFRKTQIGAVDQHESNHIDTQQSHNENHKTSFQYTTEELKEKLKSGRFDINAKYRTEDDENTLLYMAAELNDFNMVKFLVTNGAKIEHNNNFDRYHPLHVTTDLRIMEFFIKNGADIDTTSGIACVTLLHKAAAQGDFELAKFCIKYNANVNSELANGPNHTPLLLACENSNNPDKDQSWWGPERKHKRDYLEVIKLLLENGADPNTKSRDNETAIDLAKKSGNKEVLQILLSRTH
jgi:ankyrin repeat protein